MGKYYILLPILLLSIKLTSQQIKIQAELELKEFAFQRITGVRFSNPGNKYINMYFKDYWLPGKIILSNGKSVDDIQLKFNGSSDQLIMLTDKFGEVAIDNKCISDFYLYDKDTVYRFKKIIVDNVSSKTEMLCQFIYTGKVEIYVIRRNRYYSTITKNDSLFKLYIEKPIYLVKVNSHFIAVSNTSQKKLFELYPELKNKVIRNNKQNSKKIKDEKQFFNFLIRNEDILINEIH